MKASVLYFSVEGSTKKMAGAICEGMNSVEGVEAQAFSLSEIDFEFVKESSCVVIGTPTYYADMAGEVKVWFEKSAGECGLAGKLGGAFATMGYVHGGGNLAIQNILTHEMVYGMLVYASGGACGEPVIHQGPLAVASDLDASIATFTEYGKRMATKAAELF